MAKKSRRKPTHKGNANRKKEPNHKENPESFMNLKPSWRFNKCDKTHERWKFNCDEIDDGLLQSLTDLERSTWSELMRASGGKSRGTNNHFNDISTLTNDARKRLNELKIFEDQIFSIRLNGKCRLYGILNTDGIFNIIWKDNEHEICPSVKKNT